ncbi:maleylacetoacetate isomerase [Pacificibacter marinus]|uniref:maleylacetoacetate isomerase n=1 Tax=Pacificibacter marinus TaxID=658057 RepID=UPI001C076B30|nr:maleylacetoacetate isomerase [Pacificibacter marinus]MBU2867585.1 maleylacetoacetate isomerase [Pacificibacter marinus]
MKLFSYWRSTTSYRVRAALNLKGVAYETVPVDLVAGAQSEPDYVKLNPGAGVPTLILEDGTALTQSMAILDYIDAIWPEPRLIPEDPLERARVLAVAHGVAMDIHPVNNLRVVQALGADFGATPAQKKAWMQKWMAQGFAAIETQISNDTAFAFGDVPSLADLCIVSQMYNAHRWDVPLTAFPKLTRVTAKCLALPAIAAAHPDNQPDAKEII